MKLLLGLILFLLTASEANAITCGPVPYTFVPGTTIQSNQVNSNFTALQSCITGVAGSGTNADINILNGTGSGVAVFGAPTNSNAGAGYVGEYISSDVPVGSAVSLSTGTAKNITSVSLTPGDWDCSGTVDTQSTGVNFLGGWTSTTANTTPTGSYETTGFSMAQQGWQGVITAAAVGMVRYSLSVTTTVYLEMFASGSSLTGYGFLRCRRVR